MYIFPQGRVRDKTEVGWSHPWYLPSHDTEATPDPVNTQTTTIKADQDMAAPPINDMGSAADEV